MFNFKYYAGGGSSLESALTVFCRTTQTACVVIGEKIYVGNIAALIGNGGATIKSLCAAYGKRYTVHPFDEVCVGLKKSENPARHFIKGWGQRRRWELPENDNRFVGAILIGCEVGEKRIWSDEELACMTEKNRQRALAGEI